MAPAAAGAVTAVSSPAAASSPAAMTTWTGRRPARSASAPPANKVTRPAAAATVMAAPTGWKSLLTPSKARQPRAGRLGAASRTQAAERARQLGLIP